MATPEKDPLIVNGLATLRNLYIDYLRDPQTGQKTGTAMDFDNDFTTPEIEAWKVEGNVEPDLTDLSATPDVTWTAIKDADQVGNRGYADYTLVAGDWTTLGATAGYLVYRGKAVDTGSDPHYSKAVIRRILVVA